MEIKELFDQILLFLIEIFYDEMAGWLNNGDNNVRENRYSAHA